MYNIEVNEILFLDRFLEGSHPFVCVLAAVAVIVTAAEFWCGYKDRSARSKIPGL